MVPPPALQRPCLYPGRVATRLLELVQAEAEVRNTPTAPVQFPACARTPTRLTPAPCVVPT